MEMDIVAIVSVACLLQAANCAIPSVVITDSSEGKTISITKEDGTVALTGQLMLKAQNENFHSTQDDSCVQLSSIASTQSEVLEDCYDLGSAHWYGGPEQRRQYWPIEKAKFADYSYVTKEQDFQGIAEPYWLSSEGVYIHVHEGVPLFIDLNNQLNNHLCLIAKNAFPYPNTIIPTLNYTICTYKNARVAHEHAIQDVLGKPSGYPDETMIRYPIWSTWARYKAICNESAVLKFANSIVDNNFTNSQLEIDEDWEVCHGAHTFDKTRYPNMKNLTDILKSKGFRVTIWIHPFINIACEPWHSEALEKDFLVKNINGSVVGHWWNGDTSAIDFTKPDAAEWYTNSLKKVLEENGIDSFKFDAGETSYLPPLPVLNGTEEQNPSIYTNKYVNTVSQFGSMIEVRTGQRSQNLPMFVRMLDKDTKWTWENGLKTLVTTMLVMNMVGYTHVLPDMIGGNGYGTKPTKELFIRWLQANVFMPSMQYSFAPWDFDAETIEISRKYTDLHVQYAEKIIELFKKTVEDGSPVNPPIWWIDPTDQTAQTIDSEYLLGEDILVAPVLDEGATSRDIYLPKGEWQDELRSQKITGPIWLRDYKVALDELPYFTRLSA